MNVFVSHGPFPSVPLGGISEDHSHSLNRCPYLSLPFSIIRRLWGAVIHDNTWNVHHNSAIMAVLGGSLCPLVDPV